ncbi:MAG: filamentous hemagglutinin N-terminal domain-containing protein, partial [Microcystaceae cyanobacterium]
ALLLSFAFSEAITAQIVPDKTLPARSSVIINGNTSVIEGGTTAGRNLFHSFEQFSVLTRSTAYFNNSLDIQNIFSRVTGRSPSEIDGLIRANGTANLFFLNPNGILFGPNASLDIGGSFLATTANSIIFADGFHFIAGEPSRSPILTVSVPVGLGFGNQPGPISLQGTGHNLELATLEFGSGLANVASPILGSSQSLAGLRTSPGKTLALVGGAITLDGGILTAPSGNIEIGSVAGGIVGLTLNSTGLSYQYSEASGFQDIKLTNKSLLDTSGILNGQINWQGKNLSLENGAIILVSNFGSLPSGAVTIKATDSLTLNVGDLKIVGKPPLESTFLPSSINTFAANLGRAGNIQFSGEFLKLQDGGVILSQSFGLGAGGNITVDASKSLEVTGGFSLSADSFASSILGTTTLTLGNGGNILVNTEQLKVEAGGRVNATTTGLGRAGNIRINARHSLEVSGQAPDSPNIIDRSQIIASGDSVNPFLARLFGLPDRPQGDSGSITLNSDQLTLQKGGLITVRNDGTGNAGGININADSIVLDHAAGITASTQSGEGGNITLTSKDIRLLNGSEISATAGGTGNGGNILIDTNTLVALENSDIRANAFAGRGGNIEINAQGVFLSPDSEISASSELGIDGTVKINTPDTQLQNSLEQFNANVSNREQVLAGSCLERRQHKQKGSFTYTGVEGLPVIPSSAPSISIGKPLTEVQPVPEPSET